MDVFHPERSPVFSLLSSKICRYNSLLNHFLFSTMYFRKDCREIRQKTLSWLASICQKNWEMCPLHCITCYIFFLWISCTLKCINRDIQQVGVFNYYCWYKSNKLKKELWQSQNKSGSQIKKENKKRLCECILSNSFRRKENTCHFLD